MDSASLRRRLQEVRGDLDWIVMKSLEKDRNRRYETVNALARDIERHLEGEPVLACPPSASYRVRKFVRRHRLSVAVTGVVTLSVVAGLVGIFWQWRRAEANALESRQNEFTARQNLYAADINQIQHSLAADNLRQARELLQKQIPKYGEADLRGFEWRYLWRQCQSEELFSLPDHQEIAKCLAFSPDGRMLATGSRDKTAKIWDLGLRRAVATLTGGTEWINSVSFSPRGDLIATASSTEVFIWDAKTFQRLRTLPGAERKAKFSPKGDCLISYKPGGMMLWDTQTWSVKKSSDFRTRRLEMGSPSFGFAISPDGQRLGVLTDDGVKILGIPDFEERGLLKDHMPRYGFVAFSPDARIVAASTAEDGSVKLWNIDTQQETKTILCHSDSVFGAAFAPDGKTLATCSPNQTVKLWDSESERLLSTFKGHSDEVWDVSFSPDGKMLASVSKDGAIKLWDATARNRREMEVREILPFGFGSDGNLTAFTTNGWLKAFDLATLQEIRSQPFDSGRKERFYIYFGNLFRDGRTAGLVFPEQHKVDLWDLDRRQFLCSVDNEGPFFAGRSDLSFSPFAGPLVLFAPNKRFLATSTSNQTVSIWQMPQGLLKCVLTNAGRPAALSPDETMLATKRATNITVWKLEPDPPRQMLSISSPKDLEDAVVFSPDGQVLAGSERSLIKIWDLSSGKPPRTFTGHKRGEVRLAFNPDGKTLASLCEDRTVRLWHMDTGRELIKFQLSFADWRLGEIRFSPDGSALVAAISDTSGNSTRVWYAPSFEEIASAEAKDRGKQRPKPRE